MGLVSAKCTTCDGILEVDASQKTANCPHCGAVYIVQEAINKFNVTNVVNIENANLVLDHRQYLADHLEATERIAYQLENYVSAIESFEKLADEMPEEYRVWKGLVVSKTGNFNEKTFAFNLLINQNSFFYDLMKDYENARRTDAEASAKMGIIMYKMLDKLIDMYKYIAAMANIARKKSQTWSSVAKVFDVFRKIALLLFFLAILPTILIDVFPIIMVVGALLSGEFSGVFDLIKKEPESIELISIIIFATLPLVVLLVTTIFCSVMSNVSNKKSFQVYKKVSDEIVKNTGIYEMNNMDSDSMRVIGDRSRELIGVISNYREHYFMP